jgi:hypothetical protein
MSCQARRRWKTGNVCASERPVQTESNALLQARLEQMKAERTQQDTMWQDPPAELIASHQSQEQKVTLPSRRDGKQS